MRITRKIRLKAGIFNYPASSFFCAALLSAATLLYPVFESRAAETSPPAAEAAQAADGDEYEQIPVSDHEQAADKEEAVEADFTLPVWDAMPKDYLLPIARCKAWILAMDKALQPLKSHTLFNLGTSSDTQRLVMAMGLYRPAFSEPDCEKNTDRLKAVVCLTPPAQGLAASLGAVAADVNMAEWRKAALDFILPKAAEAAELVLKAHALYEGGSKNVDEVFFARIHFLSAQIKAWLILYETALLPGGDGEAPNPQKSADRLRAALDLDANNPVLWAAFGEKLIELDQPLNALSALDRALSINSKLGPAFYLRGLAQMRLNHLALAETDLNQAIKLNSANSDWLRARGAVRMLREDFEAMCQDFLAACSLGDCEGLGMARKKGLCKNNPAE